MSEPATPQETVSIPCRDALVPKHLELPAQYDTEGRCWPCGGLQRLVNIPLAHLLEAGCTVRWRLPSGELIDADVGAMLVAARQADIDKGYQPQFATPAGPVEAVPEGG